MKPENPYNPPLHANAKEIECPYRLLRLLVLIYSYPVFIVTAFYPYIHFRPENLIGTDGPDFLPVTVTSLGASILFLASIILGHRMVFRAHSRLFLSGLVLSTLFYFIDLHFKPSVTPALAELLFLGLGWLLGITFLACVRRLNE